jgi:hypothetical protein
MSKGSDMCAPMPTCGDQSGAEGTSRQPKGRLAPDTLRPLILAVLIAQAPREAWFF